MKISQHTIKTILTFLLVNFAGFNAGPLAYALVVIKFKMIDLSKGEFTQDILNNLITGATITWLVCAVFSIAVFFRIGKKWRMILMLAPIFAPLFYTLYQLFQYV